MFCAGGRVGKDLREYRSKLRSSKPQPKCIINGIFSIHPFIHSSIDSFNDKIFKKLVRPHQSSVGIRIHKEGKNF